MELDNTALEVRLEAARNQLLIQKWEKERALAKQHQSDKEEESGTESQDPQIKGTCQVHANWQAPKGTCQVAGPQSGLAVGCVLLFL